MRASFHMTLEELTPEFLNILKKQFKKAKIDILLRNFDETDYLNMSQKNKELLEKSIKEIENGNCIKKSLEELDL